MALEDVVRGAGSRKVQSPPIGLQVIPPASPLSARYSAGTFDKEHSYGTCPSKLVQPAFATEGSGSGKVSEAVAQGTLNADTTQPASLTPSSTPASAGDPKLPPGTSNSTPMAQVRPSYAQTLKGVNPLFEISPGMLRGLVGGSFPQSFEPNFTPIVDKVTDKGKGKVSDPQPVNMSQSPDPPQPNVQSDQQVQRGRIVCNMQELDVWQERLEARAVIGSCFGPRPPAEHLKAWMSVNWGAKGIKIPHVQYMSNGYFVFMFEDPEHSQFVLSKGTWLFKNYPLLLQPWTRYFNPRGPRSTVMPVWVDFPDLPLQFYPWLKEIGSQLGVVKGHKPVPNVNPKWEPQLLIDVDTASSLKEEVIVEDGDGIILHIQKVVYNLSN